VCTDQKKTFAKATIAPLANTPAANISAQLSVAPNCTGELRATAKRGPNQPQLISKLILDSEQREKYHE